MSSNELREHFLEWRAPLRGARICTVAWAAEPAGPTFSNLRVQGTKTVVDITAPAIGAKIRYAIRCKMLDTSGHTHETEPAVELTVQPGGNF
jgi:hypothetical protein